VLGREPLHRDLEVELPHPGEQRLLGVGVRLEPQRRIRRDHAPERDAERLSIGRRLRSMAKRRSGSGARIASSTSGASGAHTVSPPVSGKPMSAPISPASSRVTSSRSSATSWTSRPTRSFRPAREARIVIPFSIAPLYTSTNVS